ncbi:hypothetical protein Tco_0611816 [Tanacetum coccineum]
MVAYLEKSEGSAGFHEIIDFLNSSHIKYALTENPTIYVSFIKQFWSTATASTNAHGQVELTASIDGQEKTITEASLRRHLKLEDNDGVTSLPNSEIFEQLALMRDLISWSFVDQLLEHLLSPVYAKAFCMRTRNSNFPNNSPVTIPRCRNRRRAPNIVEPELRTIVEVAPMAERTMEELLQAPTEGYGEAIVIPKINADHFEIKTNLLQLVQASPFHGFERENPHTHINNFKRITSTLKFRDVPNDVIKLMMFPYSLEGAARVWMNTNSRESFSKTDERIDKLADQISTLVEIVTKKVFTPATVKAVEEPCVTCSSAHAYYNFPNTDSNQSSICAATVIMKSLVKKKQKGAILELKRRHLKKVNMDDPNITMEEYIRLEKEKARKRGKVYNWETATYGKIWYDEDVHDLRSVETEFPAIVFNDAFTSEVMPSYDPMVGPLNDNKFDFRISFDESDDEDYTVIYDKNSFSYKIIYVDDLKTDSENDNNKVNMPLFPSPNLEVSYSNDLDFFKEFENEYPAIVYNDGLTSKLDFLTEPTVSPQHIDEFDLNDETSLSECDEKEQNILYFNKLFPFKVIYPDDLKSDTDNDNDKIDIEQPSGDLSIKPLPNVIKIDAQE